VQCNPNPSGFAIEKLKFFKINLLFARGCSQQFGPIDAKWSFFNHFANVPPWRAVRGLQAPLGSKLKNLYRESWLAENRPYWLDNVLVCYDLQIQQWRRRGDQLNTVLETWQNSKKLPAPGQASIPAPDPP